MKGREFIVASNYLLKCKAEAALRSAVSRSYYALFHESHAFFGELHLRCSHGPQAHGEAQYRLNNSGDEQIRDVYRLLVHLHKYRLFADYNLDDNQPFPDTGKCALLVRSAEIGIAHLDTVRKSPTRCRQISDRIREYERQVRCD